MKIHYYIYLMLLIVSCSSKIQKVNQYVKDDKGVRQRNGIWTESYASDIGTMQGKGKYKMGDKVGLWVISFGDKIYQKERFKKYTSKVRIYHRNGVLREKGQTKTLKGDESRHWFYDGAWKYYNENAKHIYTRIYKDGNPVDSISVKK